MPRATTLLLLVPLAAGCEEEIEYSTAAPPSASATQAASFKPPPPPKSASAATSSVALPSASLSAAVGPIKWADFGGPTVKPEFPPGSRAWAVIPVSAGWETLKFSVVDVDRVEDDFMVTKQGADKRDVFVPGAFTAGVKPVESVVKGDAVVVAALGSRAFARVTASEAGKVKVRFRYAGDIQELDVDPKEVIKLDGTLRFAGVAAFGEVKEVGTEKKTTWQVGQFVHSAEEKAWLVTFAGKPLRVPLAQVKALSVHIPHKPGDKVWLAQADALSPGQVVNVEDDGLRYKVKLDSGEESSATFETVTTPLK